MDPVAHLLRTWLGELHERATVTANLIETGEIDQITAAREAAAIVTEQARVRQLGELIGVERHENRTAMEQVVGCYESALDAGLPGRPPSS